MAENEEPKTKDDIKQLLKHLEDEHRKANISDQTYKELKEKYKSQMQYMENSVADENAQSMEEITPEQAAAQQAAPAEEVKEGNEEGEKKGGLLGKIKLPSFGKKQAAAAPAPAAAAPAPAAAQDTAAMIEIEKLKTMLDAIRDQKKATDESIQSLFESIGEVRSMSIQNDANEREINSKLERITDDVATLRPKEIEKRFNQTAEQFEKYQLSMEKLTAKTDDMSEKLNKISENFKVIGNMENLANINTNVQSKLADIQEAMNYTERLASKAEKLYIDLKMELEDIIIYKSKQEGMEESMKDVLKTIDGINTKFDNYTTKKDIENERQDIMILGKETETLKNALALVQTNVPEPILNLRKEREDINIFLDSLDEQYKSHTINSADYEMIKKKNLEKLKAINDSLEREWKNFERMVEKVKSMPQPSTEQPQEAPAEEVKETSDEVPAAEDAANSESLPQPPTPEEAKGTPIESEEPDAKEEMNKDNKKDEDGERKKTYEKNEVVENKSLEPDKEDSDAEPSKEMKNEPAVKEIKENKPGEENSGEKNIQSATDEEIVKDIKDEMNKDEKSKDKPKADNKEKEAKKKEKKKSLLNLPF